MTSDEIRSEFLAFFERKGHKIIPSSSLIPRNDPTLLLTSAGMVQLKPYFLGKESPPNPRMASCQKCFRTTDIELVGDPTHLTFFEMLGNFSVGDYFKQEAIDYAWEFVTKRLGISPQRLWISILRDDDESFRIWRSLGVSERRVLRFSAVDNFWGPAGDSGPCGPCSEIYYDFGEKIGCGKPSCSPSCGCGRFTEMWNLVFTQYNQDVEGNRTPLPKPNIDTGMGLERTAAIMRDKTSVYETDIFIPLLERIAGLAGKRYGSDAEVDNIMRIIAEHSRGIAFLIGDGVYPDNEGEGYVLRRLLRRAALFSRRLGVDKPFLAETAKTTIDLMGHVYPELLRRQSIVIKVVELEEARFGETLKTGLELLDGIRGKLMDEKRGGISGKDAFKLYDTYGFPVELTTEIASECGLYVDLEGFEKEMEKQRKRARATHKFEIAERANEFVSRLHIPKNSFIGHDTLKHQSVIISLVVNDKSVERIEEGQEAGIVLSVTPFYAEMGGQVGDTGEIRSSTGRFLVNSTIRFEPDIILHRGEVVEGYLLTVDAVEAEVDRERRLDIARNHTATHLLQAALQQIIGEDVQQKGSMVAPDRLRFDFSHLVAMTNEEIQKVSHIVNEKIRQNLTVYDKEIPYKQAIEEGAIALFDEKYGGVVRVVSIGEPPVSLELCGGTHVTATGEIGYFHITSESSIGSGLRRIEAVTGRAAEEYINVHLVDLQETAKIVEASLENVVDKVSNIAREFQMERKQRQALESELARITAESLLIRAEVVSGVRVLAVMVRSFPVPVLREMSDFIRQRLKSVVVVLGTIYEDRPVFLAAVTPDLVERGYNAGEIVRQVAGVTGGSGGGKAKFAQAGGKDKNKVGEALRLVKDLIQSGGE